jgi:serine/threonine protein kinase
MARIPRPGRRRRIRVGPLGLIRPTATPRTGTVCRVASARPDLIDVDLATTFAEDRPGFVRHRDVVGAEADLPPEQAGRTGMPVDHPADLYADGVLLQELAAGRPPFTGDDDLRQVLDGPGPGCDPPAPLLTGCTSGSVGPGRAAAGWNPTGATGQPTG